jgi:cytochrome c-type biogenesis protein
MVYLLGLFLLTEEEGAFPGSQLLLPSAAYTLGFSIVYALLSSRGIDAGRFLISNINNLRILAGIFIAIISLHFFLAARISSTIGPLRPITLGVFPFILGLSFAIIYSPCVTPTYARILQIAIVAETANQGGFLAWAYGLGMGLSFSVVAMAIIFAVRNMPPTYKPLLRNFSAVVLGVLALMNMTGVMVYYKAFFLGLLV